MSECHYASEPFDLRLTMLRLVRNLFRLIFLTALGTVLFGGGYYVKNVLLGEPPRYEKTLTCKIEYTNPPVQSGDYYINEMTWNTYVESDEFLGLFPKAPDTGCLSAKVASDIHVPSFIVSTEDKQLTEQISGELAEVLTGAFVEHVPEIASMKVMDVSETILVYQDVRPLRAVILSGILSAFFVVVFFLLREIGADSIWLPATLRRRYGLKSLGTIHSVEFWENLAHAFGGMGHVSICTVDEEINPEEVEIFLQSNGDKRLAGVKWQVVPAPVLCPEAMEVLRRTDGVLLVVNAGLHAGKPLEYALEFFNSQDIEITAAVLWDADEALIRSYYFLPGGRS